MYRRTQLLFSQQVVISSNISQAPPPHEMLPLTVICRIMHSQWFHLQIHFYFAVQYENEKGESDC